MKKIILILLISVFLFFQRAYAIRVCVCAHGVKGFAVNNKCPATCLSVDPNNFWSIYSFHKRLGKLDLSGMLKEKEENILKQARDYYHRVDPKELQNNLQNTLKGDFFNKKFYQYGEKIPTLEKGVRYYAYGEKGQILKQIKDPIKINQKYMNRIKELENRITNRHISYSTNYQSYSQDQTQVLNEEASQYSIQEQEQQDIMTLIRQIIKYENTCYMIGKKLRSKILNDQNSESSSQYSASDPIQENYYEAQSICQDASDQLLKTIQDPKYSKLYSYTYTITDACKNICLSGYFNNQNSYQVQMQNLTSQLEILTR